MGDAQKKPIDYDDLYPGRFLKAGQFHGKKVTLTIADVETEKLATEKGEQVKGLISFKATEMQLVLNRTNGVCLKAMFGRAVADWVGKRVVLFPDTFRDPKTGEMGPCIRIWGSPDIERDLTVTIQLPQRKPSTMVMHAIRGKPEPEPARERAPVGSPPVETPPVADEMDPEPGASDAP